MVDQHALQIILGRDALAVGGAFELVEAPGEDVLDGERLRGHAGIIASSSFAERGRPIDACSAFGAAVGGHSLGVRWSQDGSAMGVAGRCSQASRLNEGWEVSDHRASYNAVLRWESLDEV